MRDIIFNKMWVQDKIYFGRNFACLKYKSCFILQLNLEKHVIHSQNFMSDLFILIYSGEGGGVHETF
jgi:hypothetical protein